MASLGDLTLFVSAETKKAQQDIQGLGREVDKVTSEKREFNFSVEQAKNNIKQIKRDIQTVGETAKVAFKVASMEGFLDDEIESAQTLGKKIKETGKALNDARKPGEVLNNTFKGVAGSAVGIVEALSKVGFALYGIQQLTGVLKQAFGGLFNATVGESIRLQESILKTQTALASTNEVLRNGEVITDPYEAIVGLTGTIQQRIASIRDRSLELAGVTSNEVIEVFGMVAQQVGQIGGSLKDAEDLAISFAGALGTFGIPLYQARQEIGSILRGDITTDSYLAKSLGITNEDVKKAKTSTEGVVGFLETRLKTAVAGQRIAAESFAGVASNIADFKELFGQAFGDGLVQPLIQGLTKVYDLLVLVKDNALLAATSLGQAFGSAGRILGGAVAGGVGQTAGGNAEALQASNAAQAAAQKLSASLTKLALDIRQTFQSVVQQLTAIIAKVGAGLAKLGAAFVGLNVSVFKSLLETFNLLVGAVSNFATAFEDVLTLYAGFLSLPLVQTLASVGAQFKLLETLGVGSLVKVILTGGTLIATFGKIKAAIAAVVAFFQGALSAAFTAAGAALQAFATAIDLLLKKLGIANVQLSTFIGNLNKTGASASATGAKLGMAAGGAKLLGKGIMALTIKMLAFNAILVGVQLLIAAIVQGFAEFEKRRKAARAVDEFNESMTRLDTTFKNVDKSSTAANQALKSLEEASASNKLKEIKEAYIEAAIAAEEYAKKVEETEARVGGRGGRDRRTLDNQKRRLNELNAEREKKEREFNEASAKHKAYLDQKNIEQEVTTRSKALGQANERLARQQEDLARSVADREFSYRMQLQRKQNELFIAQEHLRIQGIENANAERLRGEEGAAAEFLRGLNTYLADKERGELDIEAKRREQVIKTNELEKAIKDYAYQIQQKVNDLIKAGAKVQKDAADYQLMRARQSASASAGQGSTAHIGNAGALVEILGAKESFGGNYGAFNRGGSDGGHTAHNPGINPNLPSMKISDIMAQQALPAGDPNVLHAVGKYQIIAKTLQGLMSGAYGNTGVTADMPFSPENQDKLFAALARNRVVAGDAQATMAGLRQEWIGLQNVADDVLLPAVQQLMDYKQTAADTYTPPDISAIEEAQRGVHAINEELIAVQEKAAQMAQEKGLNDLVQSIAPDIAIKNLQDMKTQLETMIQLGDMFYDPEKANIMATQFAKEADMVEQYNKALAGAEETAKEYGVTVDEIKDKAHEAFYGPEGTIAQLDEETKALLTNLNLRKQIALIQGLQRDTRAANLQANQTIVSAQAQMQAGQFYNPVEQQRALAQGRITNRRLEEEERLGRPLEGEELVELQKFADAQLFNAEKLGQLEAFQTRFEQLGQVAAGVGDAISGAFTQGFADILNGSASVQDVLSNMFKNIGQSFMQLAQQIIADMIKMLIFKQLLGLFGGGGMGGISMGGGNLAGGSLQMGAGGNVMGALGPNFGIPQLAKGGIVTAPTMAQIGEGGMNEAVVPLPNGKAIPVDLKGMKGAGGVTSNVTVNVNNEGGGDNEMSGDNAGKLGKAIDGAIRKVIMDEKRSGGLLYSG